MRYIVVQMYSAPLDEDTASTQVLYLVVDAAIPNTSVKQVIARCLSDAHAQTIADALNGTP